MYNLELHKKEIPDFECYEIKTIGKNIILSVNTQKLADELKKEGKRLHIIGVFVEGRTTIQIKKLLLEELNYTVQTHHGRKNYKEYLPRKK